MPTMRNQARLWEELRDRYGALVAKAFMDAVNDLRDGATIQAIVTALETGNLDAALNALNLDPAAYDRMLDQIRDSYLEGGRTQAGLFPAKRPDGTALVVRFDGRNFRAEAWLRDHSSRLVTRIMEDQRQAVRTVLTDGMAGGRNPRSVALDIVGRINRATGKREGGILGLSGQQERAVASARAELASGDPTQLRAYLERKRRDKRFDRAIQRAIRDGKPVPADTIAKASTAYERRLLQLRGEAIGRTEAMASIHAGQFEALEQAVESGQVQQNAVRRIWRTASDARVRDTHRNMNGDSIGMQEVFTSPSGARMRFPGDTSLGAPASEVVNCRCGSEVRIDFLANIR